MGILLVTVRELINDKLFIIYTVLLALDISSGYCKGFVTGKPSSRTGMIGIVKHMSVFLFALVFDAILKFVGFETLGNFMILGLIASNGISILENYSAMNIYTPIWLSEMFKNIEKSSNDEASKIINRKENDEK